MTIEKAGKKPKSLALVLDSLDLVQGQMSVYGEKIKKKNHYALEPRSTPSKRVPAPKTKIWDVVNAG